VVAFGFMKCIQGRAARKNTSPTSCQCSPSISLEGAASPGESFAKCCVGVARRATAPRSSTRRTGDDRYTRTWDSFRRGRCGFDWTVARGREYQQKQPRKTHAPAEAPRQTDVNSVIFVTSFIVNSMSPLFLGTGWKPLIEVSSPSPNRVGRRPARPQTAIFCG
jgi:hypothetical protein